METAKDWKDKGNALVKEKKYKEALDCYSKAIEIDPNDPILYSNRSLMHINLSEFDQAITDAEKAISIKPEYAKAYLRKGKALEGQQRLQEALDTYKLGLEKDKTNAQLLEASQELEAQLNNPFLKNYAKLFTDPRTAQMMKDPQFRNLIDYALKDQKILMQMIQTDPRFMTVFSVLTGIDLEKMSEDVHKKSEERKREEEKKKKEEEEKRKKEEEEKKKREEEEKKIRDDPNNNNIPLREEKDYIKLAQLNAAKITKAKNIPVFTLSYLTNIIQLLGPVLDLNQIKETEKTINQIFNKKLGIKKPATNKPAKVSVNVGKKDELDDDDYDDDDDNEEAEEEEEKDINIDNYK